MSLNDALVYARENSSVIREAQLNIVDAEGQIIENKAIGLPQIGGLIDYNYLIQLPISVTPESAFNPMGDPNSFVELTFGLRHNLNIGISANWLALDGTYFYGLQAAKLFRDFRQQELTVVQQNVENSVIDAYLPALILSENVKILEKNKTNVEQLLQETRAIYEEGFVEKLDVSRLELSLFNLQTEQENLKRQLETVVNALKFTLNYPLSDELEIADSLEGLFDENLPEELAKEVEISRRPEFQTAQTGIALNELNIKRFRAAYYPSLSLGGGYQQGFVANELDNGFWFPSSFIGGKVQIPIFGGFRTKGSIQRAQVELEKAKLQLDNLERGISLEAKNAKVEYKNALERLTVQNHILELAEGIYDSSIIKYREGVGSSVEVNQSEQALYDVQRNRIQAMYDLLVAKKDLERAFGSRK